MSCALLTQSEPGVTPFRLRVGQPAYRRKLARLLAKPELSVADSVGLRSNQTGRQIVKISKWLRSASTGTKSDDLKKEVRRQTDQRMKQQKYRENNAGRLEADPRLTPRAP